MKKYLINTYIIALCAVASMVSLSSCDNDCSPLDEIDNVSDATNVPEGYFRAEFFPSTGGANSATSRAAINGYSQQIQSLVCLIYQKQADGSYRYYPTDIENVIVYEGNVGNIDPQTYEWPLKTINVVLPKGDYKAVFVGNSDPNLFLNQGNNNILTDYKSDFASARINMPEMGPQGFNEYNMFYLSTVDFSPANPAPNVLLQRVVANNVYGRDMIDANDAVSMLANNIVKQIRENNLTDDVVKGLLHSTLLDALSRATGLDVIAGGLTSIVDRLVNMLLGDILEKLNEVLLQEVTNRLQAALRGEAGGNNDLLGLNYILNPWTTAKAVDVTCSYFPKSIDFNRTCQKLYNETTWSGIPVQQKNNLGTFSLISLCGEGKISEINVNDSTDDYLKLLAPILNKVDDKVLNGLLVNIHVPLAYTQQSNLEYKTTYELLNLTLSNFSEDQTGEPLSLNLDLKDIVDIEQLVKQLLGDNILTGIVGGLTNSLLQPLINALNTVVVGLEIRLPGLNLNNIIVEGSWDATHVSDGTIAPSVTNQ